MTTMNIKPRLEKENCEFSGTGGVSSENRHCNFVPAFMDMESGRIAISCFFDGRQAPCHILEGIPAEWITRRDEKGRVQGVKGSIVSGFVRLNRFFTRQEAADFMAQNFDAAV
ncbi:hypothetical protein [Amphritea sp. HPY]|uniref:hypothetical protein n=1 Tax=Amphritea sp. HPY TaxID=3421652 RepID=UPI003D7ED848